MTKEQKEFVDSFYGDNLCWPSMDKIKLIKIVREQEAEIELLESRLKPVQDVYNENKEIDNLFSDNEWILWRAIKQTCEEKK